MLDNLPVERSGARDRLETELYQGIKAVVLRYPLDYLVCYNTIHRVAYQILNEQQAMAETIRTEQIMDGIKTNIANGC